MLLEPKATHAYVWLSVKIVSVRPKQRKPVLAHGISDIYGIGVLGEFGEKSRSLGQNVAD